MNVQSVRTTIPQVGGNLQKFRGQVKAQTQRQAQNVKVEIKRLVNYKG
ncbi:MAG TPA: hypothetical protein QF468_12030 [Nitrospinota bacterium]|jgi:hypothetical protein|nr:hypothetical protein [Nitrospinota bacterium]